jgi:hypothetical protein
MLKPIKIVGDKELIAALKGVAAEDVPFVTAYALTKTGQDVKQAEYDEMKRVFDRPTPYALNSLGLKTATKKDLTAEVFYKDFGGTPAERYLGPNVEGGPRRHKSHEKALISAGILKAEEYAVPAAGVKLDSYGNIPGSFLTRMLSQLKASRDPNQNMTPKSRKGAISRAGGQFFVLRPKAGKGAGIYQRITGSGGSGKLVPILAFVRAPQYRPRFSFYDVATRVATSRITEHVRDGWQRAMAAAKRRAA